MCDAVDDSYCARIRLSRPRLAGDTAAASLIPLAMCACRSLGLRGDESARLSDASTQPEDADPWRRGCWDQRPATNPGGRAAINSLRSCWPKGYDAELAGTKVACKAARSSALLTRYPRRCNRS